MFDVSFTELMVIGVVALVVIGPERLPKVARTLGHLVGRAQRYVNDVKADIQREVELDELRKFKDQVQEAAQTVHSSLNDTQAAISDPLKTFEQQTMSALNGSAAEESTTQVAEAAQVNAPVVELNNSESALAHVEAATPNAEIAVTPAKPESDLAVPQQLEIDALISDTSNNKQASKPGTSS